MNAPPLFSSTRLATGLPRTFIRHGHIRPRISPNKNPPPENDPSRGEQIWLFNHTRNQHVVYSLTPVMDKNKAFKQIPFNGKKLKPAVLRKDYWRPMAMIQFSEGLGVVGLSVYQKLREFRRRHELSWDNVEYLSLTKHDRGKKLNDQRGNSVADMAAVLGGAGKGNRIWEEQPRREKQGKTAAVASPSTSVATSGKLYDATVYWADAQDPSYASAWPSNVTHHIGLPATTRKRTDPEDDADPLEKGEPTA